MSAPFSYELPPERIAQRPLRPPDLAKLLVAERESGRIHDKQFTALPEVLRAGDLLVCNDSRVIPARLRGVFEDEPAQAVEVFLLSPQDSLGLAGNDSQTVTWRCIGRPLRKWQTGRRMLIGDRIIATVMPPRPTTGPSNEEGSQGDVLVQFSLRDGQAGTEMLQSALRAAGTMPIPPYIRGGNGDEEDLTDYQTIFARQEGSIAAPTASLHFTPNLVNSLLRAGIEMTQVTLHVGAASIRALDASPGGVPGAERMQVPAAVLERIDATRRAGGRVVAVGTTVMRALETAWRAREAVKAPGAPAPTVFEGETDLFIRPGFEFCAVDGLITNFHQPGTSHLLLVEAFVGRELLESIYTHALSGDYRFLSYGDGSLLW